ncbi:MAG: OmpA family protein [Saprospiraceae bacterium]|nr:OmpA family protein [Saprospiraceae bacterium]
MQLKKGRIVLLFIFLGMLGCQVTAQTSRSKNKLNKKQQKLYEQIRVYNNQSAFEKAVAGLDKLLEEVPDFMEGYHMRGSIQYDQQAYTASEKDFKTVLRLDPTGEYDQIVVYQLALVEKALGKYEEAAQRLQTFINTGYRRESTLSRAKKHLKDMQFAAAAVREPVPFEPRNMGAPISSRQAEYLPILSADGNSMIFTRRVGTQEDFFIANKQDNEWITAKPLSALNSPYNEGAQTISADGRLMVFTFCQSGPDLGGCDLFYAEKCGGDWSKPKRIEGPINTAAWEAQPSLSADGNLLLFASDRPGGQGGRDIWASRRSRSGRWGKPVNLGPSINTVNNDQCPFLHADGRTFYLCSDGRPGMGGNDLFYVRLQEDGQWGTVKNLGYPINTTSNEGTLTVSLDGTTAYFAKSPKDNPADLDIFTFPLYPEAKPLAVTYAKGVVYDSKDERKLDATVELIDLATKRTVAIVQTCEDGSYLVCLPAGKDYALNVNKDGYLFFSEHFALSGAGVAEVVELNVPLQAIQATEAIANAPASEPIILKNVFFASGSAELLPASFSELDRLWKLLEKQATIRIQINGHTDDVGSDEDNLSLSEARAKAVHVYLLEKGIVEDRLRYKGFGEARPIADNASEEGRQQNRRTEFEVW